MAEAFPEGSSEDSSVGSQDEEEVHSPDESNAERYRNLPQTPPTETREEYDARYHAIMILVGKPSPTDKKGVKIAEDPEDRAKRYKQVRGNIWYHRNKDTKKYRDNKKKTSRVSSISIKKNNSTGLIF